MTNKRKAPVRAGACAGAGFGIAGNFPASIVAQPYFTPDPGFCQSGRRLPPWAEPALSAVADLADLAAVAANQAHRAGVLAEACRAAGDLDGWELLRRRQLAHQCIQREAERGDGQP